MSTYHWLDLGILKMSTDYVQKSPWTLCQVHECHVCIRSYFDETRTRSLLKYNTPFELALFLLSCKISVLWRGLWKPGTNTGLSDKWAPWLVGWVTFGLSRCFGDPDYAFACNKCLFTCTNLLFSMGGWVGLATSPHCGLFCRQHGLICHVSFVRSHQDRLSCEMYVECEAIFDMRCDVVDRVWMTMSNGCVVKNALFFLLVIDHVGGHMFVRIQC